MTLPTRTPISWNAPQGMTFEAWQEAFESLMVAHDSLPWLIGDCLNAGERQFGEDYAQALPETRKAQETLRGYMWVASRVPIVARATALSWSHHRAVAGLEAPEQQRWLSHAQTEGLSVKAFKDALRPVTVASEASCSEIPSNSNESQAEILPPKAPPEPQITYSPQGGKAHWREAVLRCWQDGDHEWQRELLDELTLLTLPPPLKRIA